MASDLRYFEVKVTSCDNCPRRVSFRCFHPDLWQQSIEHQDATYFANRFNLTPSCPMWNETKEQE